MFAERGGKIQKELNTKINAMCIIKVHLSFNMSYNQSAISHTDAFLRSNALKGSINVKPRKRIKIPNQESVRWFNGSFCLS